MDLEEHQLVATDFPVCLFSDLHADVENLRRLFIEVSCARRFFCVGDYVDYREAEERNSEAVALCQKRGVIGVRGNHDDYALSLTGRLSDEGQDFFWTLPDVMVLKASFGRLNEAAARQLLGIGFSRTGV